jgi:hypothetical protein
MKPSDYFYKDLSVYLADMPYKLALEHKVEQAQLLITELLEDHYMTRDIKRIADIRKAISFNESLLKELGSFKLSQEPIT